MREGGREVGRKRETEKERDRKGERQRERETSDLAVVAHRTFNASRLIACPRAVVARLSLYSLAGLLIRNASITPKADGTRHPDLF